MNGPSLLASIAAQDSHSIATLLGVLVALVLGTKLLGELAQRMGQPAVLGELVAGVLLGGSVLGLLDPGDPVIAALAEIGVLILLFQIGLHTDVRSLVSVGASATTVALVGVVLPFAGGYAVAAALGIETVPALVCGAALTATSVGISARVLSDLGRLHSPEGQVVLGAAVLDDIVGLIILSVVAGIVGGEAVTFLGVTRTTAVALGFVAVALVAGAFTIPPLFRLVSRVQIAGALGLFALAFAFTLAWLAEAAGSALIIGAFAAGLILHPTPQAKEIEHDMTTLGHFFVPIFFASVGAAVELDALGDTRALLVGGSLIAVGILGKVAAGFAPWWFRGDRLLVGVAMVPRGEVGLIFAQMGLTSGSIGADLFGALMLMVLATTFVTPPALGRLARAPRGGGPIDEPGEGGIDDLVAGTHRRRPTERSATDEGDESLPPTRAASDPAMGAAPPMKRAGNPPDSDGD